MLRILEAKVIRDFRDGLLRTQQHRLGKVDNLILDVFLRTHACLLLDEVAEVIRRETNLISKVLHAWQALLMWLVASEIIIQQCLKTTDDILVGHLTGHKLASIEAHAVVQEQLDIHGDELAAELIYRALQLYLDLLQAVLENLLLLVRNRFFSLQK